MIFEALTTELICLHRFRSLVTTDGWNGQEFFKRFIPRNCYENVPSSWHLF